MSEPYSWDSSHQKHIIITLLKRWSILSKPCKLILSISSGPTHTYHFLWRSEQFHSCSSLWFEVGGAMMGQRWRHEGHHWWRHKNSVNHSLSIPTSGPQSAVSYSKISNTYESSSFYMISVIFTLTKNVTQAADCEQQKKNSKWQPALCFYPQWWVLRWSHGSR